MIRPDRVTAAVLAGGLGTRLLPAVADRPKALAEVAGRPFLAHVLERLADAGLPETVLLTGHRAGQIESAFGHSFAGMPLTYSRETTPLGTGGALRHALPLLQRDTLLVLNGDSYCDLDLCDFLKRHADAHSACTLALSRVADASRFGTVQLDGCGRVRSFAEKSDDGGPGLVNAGVYLLARRLVAELPAGRPLSLEREAFPAWAQAGQCHGYVTERGFLDIGTPESYAVAVRYFAARDATPPLSL
jgi:NDP-sugar pyrophosphorylase family protein